MKIETKGPTTVRHLSCSALRVPSIVLAAVLAPTPSMGERILDQMWVVDERRYSLGNGNHSGGMLVFGKNYSLELCEDFWTTSTGYVISEVEVGNLTFGVERPTTAWVSIYEVARGGGNSAVPKEGALYEGRHDVTINTAFDDPVFGLAGLKTTIGRLSIALSPNTQYFISIQTESGDWAYTAGAHVGWFGADVFLRDNRRNGYQGGYGWTTWRSHRWDDFESPAVAFRVEAVPEPGAPVLLLLAGGALGGVRRRRSG